MAVDTALTALSGAPAIGSKIQVVQRDINFGTNNLGIGAWFTLFAVEAGDIVLGGNIEIVTASTNTNATIDVGLEDAADLVAALSATSTGMKAAILAAPLVVTAADTIDVSCNTAALDNGVARITAIILKGQAFAG